MCVHVCTHEVGVVIHGVFGDYRQVAESPDCAAARKPAIGWFRRAFKLARNNWILVIVAHGEMQVVRAGVVVEIAVETSVIVGAVDHGGRARGKAERQRMLDKQTDISEPVCGASVYVGSEMYTQSNL